MAQLPTLTLLGSSFTRYKFETYPFDTKFSPVAAVYAITLRYEKEPGKISQRIVYIGENVLTDGYRLNEGDSISGLLWLQGKLIDDPSPE